MYLDFTVSTSTLAFVSTLHLAVAALCVHRRGAARFSPLALVSLLFAASPWLLRSLPGLLVGGLTHLAWCIACERLLPPPAAAAAAPAAPPRTTPSPGVTAAARRPPQFVTTPVMAVFTETPDTRTFRMARPAGFDFTAGQFLTVRVKADGKDHIRCYSISSSPDARGHLEITVKRQGLVSGALHATVRPGSMLSVKAPAGSFVYPAGDDRPLVLIAGGVGITPLMSMLRHALDTEPTRPVTLLYGVRTERDIVFGDEIDWLNRRHAQFNAIVAIADEPPLAGRFPGRITAELVQTMVPDITHALCLLCGPGPMLDAVTALLQSIGVARGQIQYEVFQAAVAASGGPSAQEAPGANDAGGRFDVQFTMSGKKASVDGAQTLLEASEACGAGIPSLCRAGVCGTCRTRVLEGEVHCTSQMLDAQDRAAGYVLPCVTHVRGTCRVEA